MVTRIQLDTISFFFRFDRILIEHDEHFYDLSNHDQIPLDYYGGGSDVLKLVDHQHTTNVMIGDHCDLTV